MSPRLVYFTLSLVFVAFAAYGSLVPFDLRYVPMEEAIAHFCSIKLVPLTSASKTDLVANVLLFIPAGFFLAGAALPRTRSTAVLLTPVIVGVLFVASALIEFSQIYSRVRTPSLNDMVNETMGGLIGVVAWFVAGTHVTRWLRTALTLPSALDRLTAMLIVYAAGWVFLALLPLDVTLRIQELGQKYRAGLIIVVPFGKSRPLVDAIRDLGGAAMSAIPIGALAMLLLRRLRTLPAIGAIVLGTIAVAAVEGAQLFVMSRTADTTDVLAGVLGVSAGVVIARRWLLGDFDGSDTGAAFRTWPLGALAIWCVILAVRHWSPFDFTTDYAWIKARVPELLQVPFRNYYAATPLHALWEASTKILLGIPVGILLRLTYIPHPVRRRTVHMTVATFVAALVFLVLEVGQIFLPSRYPDGTDVVLGVFGSWIGALLVDIVRRPVNPRNL